jgi:cyclopropane-fatty-acyl-phospholipid synthase
MFRPLRYILKSVIATGHLDLIDAENRTYNFGDHSGTPVAVRIPDKRTELQLGLNPNLALGEAYMDGRLILEQGTVYDLLVLVGANLQQVNWPRWFRVMDRLRFLTRRLWQFNPRSTAKRNVAHHYDLDGSLYDLFLDNDRQYSCA